MITISTAVQAFFTDRLIRERSASPHTIASYRDTLRLLLVFTSQRTGKQPTKLTLEDLDATLISEFLDHLEAERGCGARTRNLRLTAIRSLFRYCALRHPEQAALIERVLAIPPKRHARALVTFLTEPEFDALIDAPDRSTWTGRRDHALLLLAAQTGLRASELIALTPAHLHLSTGAHVTTLGKGRKRRITPLTKETVAVLSAWITERAGSDTAPLFPTRTGRALTRDALARRLTKYAAQATERCPPLREKNVTPTRAQAHRRDAPAARRHRHLRDRAVARPRTGPDDPDLSARRPRDQGTRARQDQTPRQHARPLPATGRALGVSRRSRMRNCYADHLNHLPPESRYLAPSST
jgi:integrase/recombinase XerD